MGVSRIPIRAGDRTSKLHIAYAAGLNGEYFEGLGAPINLIRRTTKTPIRSLPNPLLSSVLAHDT